MCTLYRINPRQRSSGEGVKRFERFSHTFRPAILSRSHTCPRSLLQRSYRSISERIPGVSHPVSYKKKNKNVWSLANICRQKLLARTRPLMLLNNNNLKIFFRKFFYKTNSIYTASLMVSQFSYGPWKVCFRHVIIELLSDNVLNWNNSDQTVSLESLTSGIENRPENLNLVNTPDA